MSNAKRRHRRRWRGNVAEHNWRIRQRKRRMSWCTPKRPLNMLQCFRSKDAEANQLRWPL